MKTIINNTNLDILIRGASVFTTGGGITVPDQLAALAGLELDVEVYSLDEFDKNSYLCTIGEIGPTNVLPLKKDKIIEKMLALLEKETGKKIVGLFPPEIGQESVVLECAHFLKLPIADFDPTGFRAVPYFDINIFKIKEMNFQLTPIIVANDNSELFIVKNIADYKEIEAKLREMTSSSKSGLIFIMGLTICIKELLKNKITTSSYTKALEFGSFKTQNKLLRALKPKRIVKGKVVNKTQLKQKGFLAEKVTIKDSNWNLYTLIMLNEAIFLLNSANEVIESVPDRILLLEAGEVQGISGAFLNSGTPVTIAVIGPTDEWNNKKAIRVFGPERFKLLLK